MDNQDKDFEAFLGQFSLRRHRPFPEEAAVDGSRTHRWVVVAAVAVASLLSIPLVRHFVRGGAPSATVEIAGDSLYSTGEKIVPGEPVRSGSSESTVIRLEDETEVELRARSEAVLKPASSSNGDIHVRLNSGSVLVTAAKQRTGHLYVETKDIVLSVAGTVFLVEAEPSGTSVGVIEGLVEAREGETLRQLSPGDQLSTDPLRESRRLADSISWSRSSRRLTALLPLSPVITLAGPPTPKESPRRRVASIQDPQAETPPAPQPPPSPPSPAPPAERGQQPKSDAGTNDPGMMTLRVCPLTLISASVSCWTLSKSHESSGTN